MHTLNQKMHVIITSVTSCCKLVHHAVSHVRHAVSYVHHAVTDVRHAVTERHDMLTYVMSCCKLPVTDVQPISGPFELQL